MVKRILGLRADKFLGLIIVLGIIALLLILGFRGVDVADLMLKGNQFLYDRLGEVGIYIATFGISIFGNFMIIMPVPYQIALMGIILTLPVNVLILAIFAAAGASIGELSAWLLGRGAVEVINEKKYERKSKGMDLLIKKGYGSWLVFLYAATPLPDDVLLIILGMEKFSLKKALIAAFFGKLVMVLALTLVLFLLQNSFIGQMILYGFGLDLTGSEVKSSDNPILTAITMSISISLTLAITIIDWEKVFKKRKKQLKKEKA